jgi:hypothetical protein
MSIVGRNPPPEPGRPIYYCGTCGRGSTAGPCPEHEATSDLEPEQPSKDARPIPPPRPGSREEMEIGRDRSPEPGGARYEFAGPDATVGAADRRRGLPARTGVAAHRELEAEAG